MPSGGQEHSQGEGLSLLKAFTADTPVWVHFGDHWWPGVVLSRSEVEPTIEVPSGDALPRETPQNRLVELFNDNGQVSVVEVHGLLEYTSSVHLGSQSSVPEQRRERFLLACQKANEYIQERLETAFGSRRKRRRVDENVDKLQVAAEKLQGASERMEEIVSRSNADNERRKASNEEQQKKNSDLMEMVKSLSADQKAFEEQQSKWKVEQGAEKETLKQERNDFVSEKIRRDGQRMSERDQLARERLKQDLENFRLKQDRESSQDEKRRLEKTQDRLDRERQKFFSDLNRSRSEQDRKHSEFLRQLESSQNELEKIQKSVKDALYSRQLLDNERTIFHLELNAFCKSRDEIQAAVKNDEVRLSELQKELSELTEKRDSLRNEIEELNSREETAVTKESEELPDEVMESVVEVGIQEI